MNQNMKSLQEIGFDHQTDKATFHNYLDFYEEQLSFLREKEINILEIGVYNGSSLKMWYDYFPNANIYAIDILDKKQYENERTKIAIGSQNDKEFISNVFGNIQFDLIIDDGSHTMHDQQVSFEILIDRLKNNGIYILEDLQTSLWINSEYYDVPFIDHKLQRRYKFFGPKVKKTKDYKRYLKNLYQNKISENSTLSLLNHLKIISENNSRITDDAVHISNKSDDEGDSIKPQRRYKFFGPKVKESKKLENKIDNFLLNNNKKYISSSNLSSKNSFIFINDVNTLSSKIESVHIEHTNPTDYNNSITSIIKKVRRPKYINNLYDCFLYNGEKKMLNFRLHELNEVVDKFMIIESNYTFSGIKRELTFNIDDFSEFKDKIIYKSIEGLRDNNAWNNEYHQRRSLKKCFDDIELTNNDFIILSDVDEFPDLSKISVLKDIVLFKQDFYYYHLNCKNDDSWPGSVMINVDFFKNNFNFDFQSIREIKHTLPSIIGGWHFSYFGDVDYIINKIEGFSHQEFNKSEYKNPELIKKMIAEGSDLFFRNNENFRKIELSDYLPQNYHLLLD